MALVYVLGAMSLFSIVAISLMSMGSTSYQLARNMWDIARVDATAEAALNRAVLGLLDLRTAQRWRVDGVPQTFVFDQLEVTITIQDELGRLDLNHADGSSLIGLLQSAGLDESSASQLSDKVLDWREAREANASVERRSATIRRPDSHIDPVADRFKASMSCASSWV